MRNGYNPGESAFSSSMVGELKNETPAVFGVHDIAVVHCAGERLMEVSKVQLLSGLAMECEMC